MLFVRLSFCLLPFKIFLSGVKYPVVMCRIHAQRCDACCVLYTSQIEIRIRNINKIISRRKQFTRINELRILSQRIYALCRVENVSNYVSAQRFQPFAGNIRHIAYFCICSLCSNFVWIISKFSIHDIEQNADVAAIRRDRCQFFSTESSGRH